MIKRVIAFAMAMVLLFSCQPMEVSAAEPVEKKAQVCWQGCMESVTVLQKEDGTVLAPISWLKYYGLMREKVHKDEYEYYYADQSELKNFAKRIFISKDNNDFSICFYFRDGQFFDQIAEKYDSISAKMSQKMSEEEKEELVSKYFGSIENAEQMARNMVRKNYVPIYEGTFSEKVEYKHKIWVPVEELLPLLSAKTFISPVDGAIYILPVAMTISQAIYNSDISSVTFDADRDIVGNKFMNASGFVVDSVVDKRFNRIDVIWNTGRIEDYETLFKGYLVDDESYLSAFDGSVSPKENRFEYLYSLQEAGDTAVTLLENGYKVLSNMDLDPEYYEGVFDLINPKDKKIYGGKFLEAGQKIYEYWYTYQYQIEDHREMLGAVYDYTLEHAESTSEEKEIKKWPSYKAAKNIQIMYGKHCSKQLLKATEKGLQDYIYDKGTDYLLDSMSGAAPWSIAFDATKIIMENYDLGYESIANAAVLDLVDNSVDISYKTYIRRMNENKFDTEFLNDLRLSAIMTLLSSKHAYTTYWDGKGHLEDIKKINKMLTEFYLAADGVDFDSSDYYNEKHELLKSVISNLRVGEDFIGPSRDFSQKLTFDLNTLSGMTPEMMEQMEWDVFDYMQGADYGSGIVTARVGDLNVEAVCWWDGNDTYPTSIVGYGFYEEPIVYDFMLGMTYSEVLEQIEVSKAVMQEWGELGELDELPDESPGAYRGLAASASMYLEQGVILNFYFDGTGPDSILVGAELQFFE